MIWLHLLGVLILVIAFVAFTRMLAKDIGWSETLRTLGFALGVTAVLGLGIALVML